MNGELNLDSKHIKTYASKDNARKAIAKRGIDNVKHVIVATDCGRFYPLFIGKEAMENALFRFHPIAG